VRSEASVTPQVRRRLANGGAELVGRPSAAAAAAALGGDEEFDRESRPVDPPVSSQGLPQQHENRHTRRLNQHRQAAQRLTTLPALALAQQHGHVVAWQETDNDPEEDIEPGERHCIIRPGSGFLAEFPVLGGDGSLPGSPQRRPRRRMDRSEAPDSLPADRFAPLAAPPPLGDLRRAYRSEPSMAAGSWDDPMLSSQSHRVTREPSRPARRPGGPLPPMELSTSLPRSSASSNQAIF